MFRFRNTVAHHFMNTCAYTLGESLIAKTCRYRTMTSAIVIAYLIYFEGIHSRMNMFGHLVEHTRIHHTASPDTLNLLGSLNQVARRHEFSSLFQINYP